MKTHLIFPLFCLPLALASEAALQEFTSGNKLFTSSLYKQILSNKNENFLVSPISAETILALTQSGAKDQTAEEIRTALNLPKSQEDIESAFKTLKESLRGNDLYTLEAANKVYLKNNFEIRAEFKKTAVDVFNSELENIDFDQGADAVKTMNSWVEGRTERKIQNLISPSDVNDRTRSVLINALYFKANWSSPFEKYKTSNQTFYKRGRDAAAVETMHDTILRNYYESKELDAKFLELPFVGNDVKLTIVLPNEKDGLEKIENQLEKVFEVPQYSQEQVSISLPKFKIESEVDLKGILQKLGVTKIFRDDEADLSGIAGEKGDLIVDKIKQKSFIDVSEEGVEAAAATFAVVGVPLSGIFSITPPKEFNADHPFIFYIKKGDLVLFTGRVVDPTQ